MNDACPGCRTLYGYGYDFNDPRLADPRHPLYRMSSTWWWPYRQRPTRTR